MKKFGIHVGSSTASLAISQDGSVETVTNDAGDRITPAVVAFNGKEKTVGISARQGLVRNAANTVCHVKKLLGCNFDDPVVEKYNSTHACKITSHPGNDKLRFNIESSNDDITPQTVLQAIVFNLMQTAKSRCGQLSEYQAVVAVPYHFTDVQRKLIKETATNCGFTVLQVISEPAACLLAYDIGQTREDGYSLIYRVGGQSLDVTIVYISSGIYTVVASVHKENIGGDAITDLLVKHFAEEFRKKVYCDVFESRRSVAKLVSAAENCKHVLSLMSSAQCFVESLHEGADFSSNITRARLDSLLTPLLTQFLSPIDEVLGKVNLRRTDIKCVVLAGGTLKTPKLQQRISDIFNGIDVRTSLPMDEVIAIGCACQAAIDKPVPEDSTRINSLARGIYVTVVENNTQDLFCVFPRRTLVPAHAQKCFIVPNKQDSLCIEIWEKCDTTVVGSVLLGKIVMKKLPDEPEIVANFHLRRDGSLHVSCSEKRTALNSGITIETST